MHSTFRPCLLHADWSLQPDIVPDRRGGGVQARILKAPRPGGAEVVFIKIGTATLDGGGGGGEVGWQ